MSPTMEKTPITGASAGGLGVAPPTGVVSGMPRSAWMEEYSQLMATAKIAIIDDEETNIKVVQRDLAREGYQNFFRTTDASQALSMIDEIQPDVVLLDVMMPQVTGLEILASMRTNQRMSHIPVIVLTACTGAETKLQALRLGPSDFLAKPVDANELLLRLRNLLAVSAYQDHLARYSETLEAQVRQRTHQLAESRQRIIQCLARAAEFRDDDTGHHVVRVGKYAAIIARALGFAATRIELMEQAAQLHDIGKIGVPDAILLKPGKLTCAEFELIKRHCHFGNSIINPGSASDADAVDEHRRLAMRLRELDGYPVMELAGVIALTHHERWDGSGYPRGTAGEHIPIEGRITAVADVFDALGNKRPYKAAFPRDKCFQILEDGRGTHFDPFVLDAFFCSEEEVIRVQDRYADV